MDYYISASDGVSTSTDPTVAAAAQPYSIAVFPNEPPVLLHTVITDGLFNTPILVCAQASDTTQSLAGVTLNYRKKGVLIYQSVEMVTSTAAESCVSDGLYDTYAAVIPADQVTLNGVEYFVEAVDDYSISTTSGTADKPNFITITDALPIISVTPVDGLYFSGVNVGDSASAIFSVQNGGSGTLVGTCETGAPFSVFGCDFSLAAGEVAQVIVTFSPDAGQEYLGHIVLSSNGGNSSIEVSGVGIEYSSNADKPKINRLFPSESGAPGDRIFVYGDDFGVSGLLFLDGDSIQDQEWYDTFITFVVPEVAPGRYWLDVFRIDGAIAKVHFEVLPDRRPLLETIRPNNGGSGTTVILDGHNFGEEQGPSSVTIGGVTAPVVSWSDKRIAFKIPLLDLGHHDVQLTTTYGEGLIDFFVRDIFLLTERTGCDETFLGMLAGTCMVVAPEVMEKKPNEQGISADISIENIRPRWYELEISGFSAELPEDLPILIGPVDRKGANKKTIKDVLVGPLGSVHVTAYGTTFKAMGMFALDLVSIAAIGQPIPTNDIDTAIAYAKINFGPLGGWVTSLTTDLADGDMNKVISHLRSLPGLAKDPSVRYMLRSLGISESSLSKLTDLSHVVKLTVFIAAELKHLTSPQWDSFRIYAK